MADPAKTIVTEEQTLAVLGLMTLLIHRRQELDKAQDSAAEFLRSLGAKDSNEPGGMDIRDWLGEATYNNGDDPKEVAKQLLRDVGLEVEDE